MCFPKGKQRLSRQSLKGINFHILNFLLFYSCPYLRPHARVKSWVFFFSPFTVSFFFSVDERKTCLLSILNLLWCIILKYKTSGVRNIWATQKSFHLAILQPHPSNVREYIVPKGNRLKGKVKRAQRKNSDSKNTHFLQAANLCQGTGFCQTS